MKEYYSKVSVIPGRKKKPTPKPKHTELEMDNVRKLRQSGEGMMINPIKKVGLEQVLKVTNIRVVEHTAKVQVICPECQHLNYYFIHPQGKFEAMRHCHGCGAILTFDCEEVKDG